MDLKCRFCQTPLEHTFVNLGMSPLSNSYVDGSQLNKMEPFYPLQVYVCHRCFLVQLPEFESPEEIFSDYSYFSSYSESWLRHSRDYTRMMINRYGYHKDSLVVEIASNDGYLLQYFQKAGIPVLGVEPAENVAKVAIDKGIPTWINFFGVETALELKRKGKRPKLLLGNNVLAHVPDINDFVHGMKILLDDDGIITMEFPHLKKLVDMNQFDTIYHEHFSYLSLTTVNEIFSAHGLTVFDVEEIPTHGGSLRIFACHCDDQAKAVSPNVTSLLNLEDRSGFKNLEFYSSFEPKVQKIKRDILQFFIESKNRRKTIAGYGAPAKGNTLLNYCGIRTDFMDFTVDRSPHKQAKHLPGTHIPIFPPERLEKKMPDYVIILPWNLKDEIIAQMGSKMKPGCKFVTLIPSIEFHEVSG